MNAPTAASAYRMIWRWHFYAGLVCLPFILWLAVTGPIYLFKPQVEVWLDRDVDALRFDAPLAPPSAQVQAALAANPDARFSAYELPQTASSAARVLLLKGQRERLRVYVDPQRLTVLKQVREQDRFMNVIQHLHGELLLGDAGSYIVEFAASWAIVMFISGLYLWWPRNTRGLGGVLYPRLGQGRRTFWRDLHAVIGLWISAFALFMLLSGLPWTKFWGGNLKALREFASHSEVKQDWSTGSTKPAAAAAMADMPGMGEHAGHEGRAGRDTGTMALDLGQLDRILPQVQPLDLAPPVLIAAPGRDSRSWTARSDVQNRPLRATLTFDEQGALLKREDFTDKKLLDRVIGTGVAAHEGQLFGWPNQLLGLLTGLGLITMVVSAAMMWWQRRPSGTLGAPPPAQHMRAGLWVVAVIVLFAVLLPLLGISLVLTLLLERILLRRSPRAREFLGLRAA